MSPGGAEDSKTADVVHQDVVAEANKLGVDVDEVVATRITEEDMNRISAESLQIRSWTGFRIVLIMVVMGCNQAGYGVDWGVISGINSMDRWHTFFGFGNSGAILGTINGLMTIGNFVGAPFLALGDVIGRRGVNFLGNFIVIVAAFMQGFSPNLACFMVGRFLLGFGSSMCSAPQYMAEIAPPHLRGRLVGIFGACFQVGSIIMTAAMMGFTKWDNDYQWRCPLILEALFPFLVCSLIYLWCPESPRYLVMKGRTEEARQVVAKYMSSANSVDSPVVPLVIGQIEESLETTRAGVKAAYDFRPFFSKAVRYRTLILCLYSLFQQWNGGGILGYYLSPSLDTVGITKSLDQLGINLGLIIVYFVFTVVGSFLVDLARRRTLIFAGLISFIILQTAVTITSWQYNVHANEPSAILTVVWYFIYQTCSASLIATMHNLYPVEILSLPLRAKGMGFYNMFQGAAGVVQSYGISVGIEKVGYKIWVVYIVYNCLQLIAAYFLFPETSKLTLEEIDSIFETPGSNPVKLSLKISRAKREKEKAERSALQSAS
ncbi:Sugar transporter [Pleurostoma richardsiae]|uniref:Sugar transporter n=1 Tax=Pleurostoma richardsiae TaxID=41990 RepID=A0AA38RFZ8_9PEZI|nr:Sugar transporter [Pleurostoma richardsiae]